MQEPLRVPGRTQLRLLALPLSRQHCSPMSLEQIPEQKTALLQLSRSKEYTTSFATALGHRALRSSPAPSASIAVLIKPLACSPLLVPIAEIETAERKVGLLFSMGNFYWEDTLPKNSYDNL